VQAPPATRLSVARKLDRAFWAVQEAYRAAAEVRGLESVADDLMTFSMALTELNVATSSGTALRSRGHAYASA
jgi:hypothetical protein